MMLSMPEGLDFHGVRRIPFKCYSEKGYSVRSSEEFRGYSVYPICGSYGEMLLDQGLGPYVLGED